MRFLLLLVILFFTSFAQAEAPRKLQVVTSFSILEDMAKQIGGDRVEVKSLVGRNSDIHSYEPKPTDAKLLKHADLLIINGFGLEGFITRLVASSEFKGDIVEATYGVTPIKNESPAEKKEHGENDPHAWQSLKNGIIYARNIATAFAAKDPEYKDYYNERLKGYILHINELDLAAGEAIAKIPPNKRSILVQHNSFAYLARDYGIRVLALENFSVDSEPSAQAIANNVDQIHQHSVQAIFRENVAMSPLLIMLSEETNMPIKGTLYSDALSERSGRAYTYFEMFQTNVETIVKGIK